MASNILADEQKPVTQKNEYSVDINETVSNSHTYGTFGTNDVNSLPITTVDYSNPDGCERQTSAIIVLGCCPACKTGILETDYTCLGLFCAIVLFPIGIVCCMALRQRRCNFCGSIFNQRVQ